MGSAIEFEWDSRDIQAFRGAQVDRALARALRLAGGQGIRLLQRGTVELVAAKKALPRSTITEDQRLNLPKRQQQIQDYSWELFIKGKPVPVAKFPHIDTRRLSTGRGVLARFGAGGSTRFSRAFVARMASGHVGVFERTGKGTGRGRLPIEELFSSRLPADLGGEVMSTLGDKAYRKMLAAFTRGLDRELGKARGRGEA